MTASGSESTFRSSNTGGTNWRPLIQPVTTPTMSLIPFFCAMSQNARNLATISGSTPASLGSGRLSRKRYERYEPPALQSPVSGWKSLHRGKTRITVTPFAASAASSFATVSGSHCDHMYMPAFFAQ